MADLGERRGEWKPSDLFTGGIIQIWYDAAKSIDLCGRSDWRHCLTKF
jgi:hypothetical protein